MTAPTEKLLPPYVVGHDGGDFTDYSCETHAKEFARTWGLTWDGSGTEEHPSGLYAYEIPFADGETDSPVACHCDQYLDVSLTTEGEDYMRENDFPEWLYTAHHVSK
jgi:hypothetical protein